MIPGVLYLQDKRKRAGRLGPLAGLPKRPAAVCAGWTNGRLEILAGSAGVNSSLIRRGQKPQCAPSGTPAQGGA
jgi:hypothetical protein